MSSIDSKAQAASTAENQGVSVAKSPSAEDASRQRVEALRANHPGKSVDELVEVLIRKRCLQIASVGAATAGAAAIPSVGSVAPLAVGSVLDLDATAKAQRELVLDIATLHNYRFKAGEQAEFFALTLEMNPFGGDGGAVNPTAEQLLKRGGQQLARQATQRFAHKSVARALPFVGVATSAGSNILMTYAAAQRAKAYITQGPESIGDWESSIRISLGVDELVLSDWTRESLASLVSTLSDAALDGIDQGAQKAGRAAGKATRKFAKFLQKATKPKP